MKVAIVTTLRDAERYLDFFIRFHLSMGFIHIFLFFDDKDDESFKQYIGHSHLTIVRQSEELLGNWEKGSQYKLLGRYTKTECMARQILNVEIAIERARALNFDWLLHIDIDELFYCPRQNVSDFFRGLSRNGIEIANFVNHEAVVEKMYLENIFEDTHFFKKNRRSLNASQKELIEASLEPDTTYFSYYGNGKSAVRLSKYVTPVGVHNFRYTNYKRLNFISKWKTKFIEPTPCILHFACCDFDTFLEKYKTLGNFGDKWFDRGESIRNILPIHVKSRDICQQNELADVKEFYRVHFIEKDLKNLDLFLQEGIYMEVALPIK